MISVSTYQRLTLNQRNDEWLDLYVIDRQTSAPYDLSDATIHVVIKPDAGTDDTDEKVVTLTTTAGDVVIEDAEDGHVTATVPGTALAEAGMRWWRLDVVRPGARRTAVYGDLHVVEA